MRKIDTIVVHYTATPEGRHHTAADIRRWHLEREFNDIGYHYVVQLGGIVERGRHISLLGAHVSGKNTGTIGICYVGGLRDGKSADTRTPEQKVALHGLINSLRLVFGPLRVVGHRDLAATLCPGFDAIPEYN